MTDQAAWKHQAGHRWSASASPRLKSHSKPCDSSSGLEDTQALSWGISSFLGVTNSSLEGVKNLTTVSFQEMTDFKEKIRTQSKHQSVSVPHCEGCLEIRSNRLLLECKKEIPNAQAWMFWRRPCIPGFFFQFSLWTSVHPRFYLTPVRMAQPAGLCELGAGHRHHSARSTQRCSQPPQLHRQRARCQGLAPTITCLVPLLPAHRGVPDPAAAVHHSTGEGQTGLISNPPQTRSVLNPSKTKHFAS